MPTDAALADAEDAEALADDALADAEADAELADADLEAAEPEPDAQPASARTSTLATAITAISFLFIANPFPKDSYMKLVIILPRTVSNGHKSRVISITGYSPLCDSAPAVNPWAVQNACAASLSRGHFNVSR